MFCSWIKDCARQLDDNDSFHVGFGHQVPSAEHSNLMYQHSSGEILYFQELGCFIYSSTNATHTHTHPRVAIFVGSFIDLMHYQAL